MFLLLGIITTATWSRYIDTFGDADTWNSHWFPLWS
jgi:hypothetical protein